MIVLLLDRAKEANLCPGNLFRPSLKIKSSRCVLREICHILLPSIGDIHRTLSHLGYHVHHTQFELSEYQYRVDNLATDLRDGVRFARLTEILFSRSETLVDKRHETTVLMPGGESLTTKTDANQAWILSQHLKFPCTTRAQKIYNVQVTLSALREVQRVRQIAETISAEDIVDGHRERSLTLLWGLIGKWVRYLKFCLHHCCSNELASQN